MRSGLAAGFAATINAASLNLATLVFLPGVLLRVALQKMAALTAGSSVRHEGFLTELGGEVTFQSGPERWERCFWWMVLGLWALGSVLLFPFVLREHWEGHSVLGTVVDDRSTYISQSTSFVPFFNALYYFGGTGLLRLWVGISCFYASVPSDRVLRNARTAISARRPGSPARVVGGGLVAGFRALRAVDQLLAFLFAGSYLASGLVLLIGAWHLLRIVVHVV